MAEKLSIQIALEGGKEIEKQLADIGAAGQKAFADIEKSASQAGGFKELKPEEVTAKLEQLGITGTAAFDKIQAAVKSAGRWESAVQGVAALETAFVSVAKAAAVVGTAVVAAGVALSRYTSQAAAVAEQLGPLADLSGRTVQSVSALQIAFAQGGVSVQKFASEFTNLELKVAEAARTMAADVEASSQRIEKAQLNVAQSAHSVAEAELALEELRLKSVGIDPATDFRIQSAKKQLALEAAQQRLAAARQQQQAAAHQLRVAEANDLDEIILKYMAMGEGIQTAFDPLTTQATKNQALFARLANAGKDYTFVLADILKNASALERVQIAKALGLDPKTVETLQQGSEALKAQQQAVADLGIALTDADRNKLQAFSNTWSKLGATALAALEKLGAALAPIGTLIGQGLQVALEAVILGFQAFASAVNTVATAGAAAINFMVNAVIGLGTAIGTLVSAIGNITWDVLQTGVQWWAAIKQGAADAKQAVLDFAASLPGIAWDAITSAAATAWDAVKQGAADAKQAVLDFAAALPGIAWEAITSAAATAWDAVKQGAADAKQAVLDFAAALPGIAWEAFKAAGVAAWQAIIDKVKEFLGLKPQVAPATSGGGGAPGNARGGLLGGRGTGTSDSNLAWVSRGEYVMPARAVRQPGVLSFLEALRRSGNIPGFAAGGSVPIAGIAFSGAPADKVLQALQENTSVLNALKQTVDTLVQTVNVLGQKIDGLVQVVNGLWDITKALAQSVNDVAKKSAGQAGGGLLGGRGTGTSDSNLAWVSRGEHIMPARAVAQPGVLAFLEALRRSGGNLSAVLDGMGRFALGGMIRGPMPAFAAGGLAGGMSNVTIQFPGLPAIGGLRASSDVVDQLHKAAALAQVRSGGRKPSRYS